MNKEEIEEIDTLEIDFNDIDELNLALEVSSKKAIYLIDNLTKSLLELQQENKQLKEQLEYLRSGEYYNQLRFERDMLQDLVEKGEVSKEDKVFIDCTHRNTELLEENNQLKECINKLDLENKVLKEQMVAMVQPNYIYGIRGDN